MNPRVRYQNLYKTHHSRSSCFHTDCASILMALFLLVSHSPSPSLTFEKHCQLIIAITFCVSQINFALRSSIMGTIFDPTSLLLLSKVHNLACSEATLLREAPTRWLSLAGILRQVYSRKNETSSVGDFSSRIPIWSCQNCLELHSSLMCFHSKFLSHLSSQGSEYHCLTVSPSLLELLLHFLYRCFP